jgi:hypothetical protein
MGRRQGEREIKDDASRGVGDLSMGPCFERDEDAARMSLLRPSSPVHGT